MKLTVKIFTVLLKAVILQPRFDRRLPRAAFSAVFCLVLFIPRGTSDACLEGIRSSRDISCLQRCRFIEREILCSAFSVVPPPIYHYVSLEKELVFFKEQLRAWSL